MFTLFVGITRVVAEGGIAATRAPLIAADFVTLGSGLSRARRPDPHGTEFHVCLGR